MANYRQWALVVAGVMAACCSLHPLAAGAQPTQVVQPLPLPGPFAVACSNVSQDFTRLEPGEDVQNYWEGVPRSDGSSRYITDLLSDPSNTLSVNVNAPDDGNVFGSFAGQSILVVVVCYPTAASNPVRTIRCPMATRCRACSRERRRRSSPIPRHDFRCSCFRTACSATPVE